MVSVYNRPPASASTIDDAFDHYLVLREAKLANKKTTIPNIIPLKRAPKYEALAKHFQPLEDPNKLCGTASNGFRRQFSDSRDRRGKRGIDGRTVEGRAIRRQMAEMGELMPTAARRRRSSGTGAPRKPRSSSPKAKKRGPKIEVEIDLEKMVQEHTQGHWCRYCGARAASSYNRGPWGKKKLCTTHYVQWCQKGSLDLSAYQDEPTLPIDPSQNTERKYLEYIAKQKRKGGTTAPQTTAPPPPPKRPAKRAKTAPKKRPTRKKSSNVKKTTVDPNENPYAKTFITSRRGRARVKSISEEVSEMEAAAAKETLAVAKGQKCQR